MVGIRIGGGGVRGSYEGRSVGNVKADVSTAEDSNGRAPSLLLFDNSSPYNGNAAFKVISHWWGRLEVFSKSIDLIFYLVFLGPKKENGVIRTKEATEQTDYYSPVVPQF